MFYRVIGCVGLLWLCGSQAVDASVSLTGHKPVLAPLQVIPMRSHLLLRKGDVGMTTVGMKGSIVSGAKEGEDNLRSAPGRLMNKLVPTAGSREAVSEPSAPSPVGKSSATEKPEPLEGDGTAVVQEAPPTDAPGYAYHPDGRRDPFLAIVQDANRPVEVNLNVPPLQRINLSEVTLIGIVWGGFGYIAMVQTPDGRGYTVREGTRIGSSDGLVSSITADALTIKEPHSDIFGRKEMREQIIPLHPKVNAE